MNFAACPFFFSPSLVLFIMPLSPLFFLVVSALLYIFVEEHYCHWFPPPLPSSWLLALTMILHSLPHSSFQSHYARCLHPCIWLPPLLWFYPSLHLQCLLISISTTVQLCTLSEIPVLVAVASVNVVSAWSLMPMALSLSCSRSLPSWFALCHHLIIRLPPTCYPFCHLSSENTKEASFPQLNQISGWWGLL